MKEPIGIILFCSVVLSIFWIAAKKPSTPNWDKMWNKSVNDYDVESYRIAYE